MGWSLSEFFNKKSRVFLKSLFVFSTAISSIGTHALSLDFLSRDKDAIVSNADAKTFPVWGMNNFNDSKRVLKEITRAHPVSFYCGCDITFTSNGKKLGFDFSSCGFQYRKDEQRANRAEAEHIVPISWVGKRMQCWQNGGRKNCQKVSDAFNRAEADLVNLQYAIGEVNGDRSDFRYGQWASDLGRAYGSCDVKIDFKNRQFEPRKEIRGWIARVHFYMYSKYGVELSRQQKNLMGEWVKLPPTQWECEYNAELKRRFGKGAGNPYTDRVCEA